MIKVSVRMLTYNHEKYIKEAIESVLMQRTNFKYELIIGEDCSTDNTRSIVLDYQSRYPEIIKVKLQKENVGSRKNSISTFSMCKGEYVALLEGDDYWTDENKLQKQVEFLENNPDCSLCGHSFRRYSEVKSEFYEYENEIFSNIKFDLEDYLADPTSKMGRKLNIRTLTVMFRKSVLDNPPDIWNHVPYGDYLLYVLCLEKGKGAFLEDIMGVYRLNSNSMTQGGRSLSFLSSMLKVRELVHDYLPERYRVYIKKDIERVENLKSYFHARNIFESGEQDEKIMEYFQKRQFSNIAIYGLGTIGNRLIKMLKDTNTKIKFVIDKSTDIHAENLVNPEQLDKDMVVDAMIITPVYDMRTITELIKKKDIRCPIIPVTDIIDL